jgi:hypothetical protein
MFPSLLRWASLALRQDAFWPATHVIMDHVILFSPAKPGVREYYARNTS